MHASFETLQSTRCTCCGSRLHKPQQQVNLPFRTSWHPLRSSGRTHHQGRRTASNLACSKKEDGSRQEQPETGNKDKEPSTLPDHLLQLMSERMKSRDTALKTKLSLREMCEREWKAVASNIPWAVGLPGSLAVVAGYYLHLDPYGHFHWSSSDALIGLACAAPVALTDVGLMVPDFSAKRIKKVIKLDTSSMQAEAAKVKERLAERVSQSERLQSRVMDIEQSRQQSDPAAAEDSRVNALQALQQLSSSLGIEAEHASSISRESATPEGASTSGKHTEDGKTLFEYDVNVRGKNNALREALHAWQQHHVLSNPGLNYLPPVEALVILLSHLTNEMLWRAIVLKGLSGWVSDRLYEAGAEDTISGIGDASMTVADTGKWTALAVLLGVRIGFAAKDFLSPPRIQVQEARGSTAAQDIPTREKRKADIQSQIAKMSKRLYKQKRASIVVDTARNSVSLAATGGSFFLTDNLLAPYIGGVTCDLLFSIYQRAKHEQLQNKTRKHMMTMMEEFKAIKDRQLKSPVSKPSHVDKNTEH